MKTSWVVTDEDDAKNFRFEFDDYQSAKEKYDYLREENEKSGISPERISLEEIN